jgi:hypothetical protein
MDQGIGEAGYGIAELGDGGEYADIGCPETQVTGIGALPGLPKLPAFTGDFARTFRFGVIDNSVLVLAAMFGLSLEDWIAEKVGVPGYGVLVGATVGNAVSDGLAGIPEGRDAAFGYFTGALLPVIPIVVAMGMRQEARGTTGNVLKAISAAMLVGAFLRKRGT